MFQSEIFLQNRIIVQVSFLTVKVLHILYSALVAQMVERKTLNLVVVGSSPTEGAIFFGV